MPENVIVYSASVMTAAVIRPELLRIAEKRFFLAPEYKPSVF